MPLKEQKEGKKQTAAERLAKERELAEKRKEIEQRVAEARALQDLEQKERDKKTDRTKLFGTHVGITCDGCSTAPVVGYRWHCLRCRNHDLCDNCHEEFKGGKLLHHNRQNCISTKLEDHKFEIEAHFGSGFKPIDKNTYTPKTKRVKPNEPCTCGSGKKFKKCCGDPAKANAAGGGEEEKKE